MLVPHEHTCFCVVSTAQVLLPLVLHSLGTTAAVPVCWGRPN